MLFEIEVWYFFLLKSPPVISHFVNTTHQTGLKRNLCQKFFKVLSLMAIYVLLEQPLVEVVKFYIKVRQYLCIEFANVCCKECRHVLI